MDQNKTRHVYECTCVGEHEQFAHDDTYSKRTTHPLFFVLLPLENDFNDL